ncbi:hypothetical protein OG292_00140 [Streptomyces sp. NBC_01511]
MSAGGTARLLLGNGGEAPLELTVGPGRISIGSRRSGPVPW